MSFLEQLVSVTGISTLGIGSLLTFKAININISRTENLLDLDMSQKIQVFNSQQTKVQHSFEQVWNLLIVAVVAAYPWVGGSINTAIFVSATIAIPIALLGTIANYSRLGLATYINLMSVICLGFIAFWVYGAGALLSHTAESSSNLFSDLWHAVLGVFSHPAYGEDFLAMLASNLRALTVQLSRLLAVIGVAIFFSSIWRLCFSFTKGRSFDDCFRWAGTWLLIGVVSWFLANNGHYALLNQKWEYLAYFSRTLVPDFMASGL